MVASSIAALFDLDGTLYTGHIATAFRVHHQTHRVKRLQMMLYLVAHMPIWWFVRAGLLSDEAMRRLWTQNMGWLVAGWRSEEALTAFQWIAEHYVLPLVRESILERALAHQQQGHRTILVSGTPAQLLEVIGQTLGIREAVGTPLMVRNGRYTGASRRPVCQGANKVWRVQEVLGDGKGIDWDQSYAYADSILDLPLLEKVGHPVAVYPDDALKAHARSQQWEILE